MTTSSRRVVIIGAGIGGRTAAIALRECRRHPARRIGVIGQHPVGYTLFARLPPSATKRQLLDTWRLPAHSGQSAGCPID